MGAHLKQAAAKLFNYQLLIPYYIFLFCRILAGLWPLPDGSVHSPAPGTGAGARPAVYYVPQKPYTTPGSLRDQVLYPQTLAAVMAPRYAAGGGRDDLDAELLELMGVVRLK